MPKSELSICVITGSRSEYGLLRWILQEIKDDPALVLRLVVAGNHMSETWGRTIDEILADGFEPTDIIDVALNTESGTTIAQSVAEILTHLTDVLGAHKPDLILVMGDRYELLAVAAAAVIMTIPIAHISGGELTGGAIDEQIRHAMTKVSHIHFVANETYARRVMQMGEESWRVCISGEPGLDNVTRLELWTAEKLGDFVSLDLSKPTALVTYHPLTLEHESLDQQIAIVIAAMEKSDLQFVVTYPNADVGSEQIIQALEAFTGRNPGRAVLIKSLGQTRYLSALRHMTMMIGNSSSALFEAPSFNIPAVNIGTRQAGRMRAENVIDVACDVDAILDGIKKAKAYDRSKVCVNPYGDGNSSGRVCEFIRSVFRERTRSEILHKQFVDMT